MTKIIVVVSAPEWANKSFIDHAAEQFQSERGRELIEEEMFVLVNRISIGVALCSMMQPKRNCIYWPSSVCSGGWLAIE